MDEALLTELDSYAHELKCSRTYFDTFEEVVQELGLS